MFPFISMFPSVPKHFPFNNEEHRNESENCHIMDEIGCIVFIDTQLATTCSKLTIDTLEQSVTPTLNIFHTSF